MSNLLKRVLELCEIKLSKTKSEALANRTFRFKSASPFDSLDINSIEPQAKAPNFVAYAQGFLRMMKGWSSSHRELRELCHESLRCFQGKLKKSRFGLCFDSKTKLNELVN